MRLATPSQKAPALLVGALAILAGCGGGGGSGSGSISQIPSTAAPIIGTTSIPDAATGAPYTGTITVTNGQDPITWRVIDPSTLPPGLSLSQTTGRTTSLAGTATTLGTYLFAIEVRDGANRTAQRIFSMDVVQGISITTQSLPAGETGEPYAATIDATGGQGLYTWSVISGALPSGIALQPSTGLSVDLAGTSQDQGTFNVTVQVEDSLGAQGSVALTIQLDDIERFVFGGDIDGQSTEQLYFAEVKNGTQVTNQRLLANPNIGTFAQQFPIYLSPDRTMAAVIMDVDTGDAYDLYIVDVDAKSPDFGRVRKANPGVFLAKPSQSQPTPAANDVKRAFWAPDSKTLAFVGDLATPNVNDLFIVDVTKATLTPVPITLSPVGQGLSFWDAHFTADGRHIVFLSDTNPDPLQNPLGQTYELFFADLASPSPVAIPLNAPLADPAMSIETFFVAPQGPGIAYVGNLTATTTYDLYYTTLDQGVAGTTAQVSNAQAPATQYVQPGFSPDGTKLLYTSQTSPTLVPLPPFGSPGPGILLHVADLAAQTPAPRSLVPTGDGGVQLYVWSPDSKSVLMYYQADDGQGGAAIGQVYLADAINGGGLTQINAPDFDGATTDIGHRPGRFGSQGPILDWALGFTANGSHAYYVQQTQASFSPIFGATYVNDLFLVDVTGAAPGVPVKVSPTIQGLTQGGIEDVFCSEDGAQIGYTFTNMTTRGIEVHTYDIAKASDSFLATTRSTRMNNNAPGPRYVPSGRGLVFSAPVDPLGAAYNECYHVDMSGNLNELNPPMISGGDITDFFALD